MPKGVYAISVDPAELRSLLSLLGKLPKEVQGQVRDMAQPLSRRLKMQLTMRGLEAPAPQTRLVVQSITTPRDRLVRADIGGAKRVGRKSGGESRGKGKKKVKQDAASAGVLLWGTEYGSKEGGGIDKSGRKYSDRFKVGHNSRGYWIAPTVRDFAPILAAEYQAGLIEVIKKSRLD